MSEQKEKPLAEQPTPAVKPTLDEDEDLKKPLRLRNFTGTEHTLLVDPNKVKQIRDIYGPEFLSLFFDAERDLFPPTSLVKWIQVREYVGSAEIRDADESSPLGEKSEGSQQDFSFDEDHDMDIVVGGLSSSTDALPTDERAPPTTTHTIGRAPSSASDQSPIVERNLHASAVNQTQSQAQGQELLHTDAATTNSDKSPAGSADDCFLHPDAKLDFAPTVTYQFAIVRSSHKCLAYRPEDYSGEDDKDDPRIQILSPARRRRNAWRQHVRETLNNSVRSVEDARAFIYDQRYLDLEDPCRAKPEDDLRACVPFSYELVAGHRTCKLLAISPWADPHPAEDHYAYLWNVWRAVIEMPVTEWKKHQRQTSQAQFSLRDFNDVHAFPASHRSAFCLMVANKVVIHAPDYSGHYDERTHDFPDGVTQADLVQLLDQSLQIAGEAVTPADAAVLYARLLAWKTTRPGGGAGRGRVLDSEEPLFSSRWKRVFGAGFEEETKALIFSPKRDYARVILKHVVQKGKEVAVPAFFATLEAEYIGKTALLKKFWGNKFDRDDHFGSSFADEFLDPIVARGPGPAKAIRRTLTVDIRTPVFRFLGYCRELQEMLNKDLAVSYDMKHIMHPLERISDAFLKRRDILEELDEAGILALMRTRFDKMTRPTAPEWLEGKTLQWSDIQTALCDVFKPKS
ncbi:unnamed protein product [Amoebophrya sp. A120]|nr:unnamed protein product [Amoebophrya sp. A120]|eukprot:GSA120T00005334001.1